MCFCGDTVSPAAYRETWRRARKVRRCDECRSPILWGDRYQYVSGIWDGYPDSYSTCAKCVELRKVHAVTTRAVNRAEIDRQRAERLKSPRTITMGDWVAQENARRGILEWVETCEAPLGQLYETIRECAREDDRYRPAFRAAMRERRKVNP